ncbi:GGDEF domain-containing protein [Ideonella alba]|uniref:diguanylate cyclase n=1 Tax=Ideonella alba TaxID=2824118 RepID=A0A940YA15_9BURK|nr:GGDEF domain-containing protein [Ideonella alba]MBQ0928917.1 GGDEF domain-containing protein [Ideonella alba]
MIALPAAPADLLRALQDSVDRTEHAATDACLQALLQHPGLPTHLQAQALAIASHGHYRRNDLTQASRLASEARAAADLAGDATATAHAGLAWARICWALGDLDEALAELKAVHRQSPAEPRLQLHLFNLLGLVHADLGQAEAAETYQRQALDSARRSGCVDLRLIALTNLAGRVLARGEAARTLHPDTAAAAWAELDRLAAEADALACAHDQELTLPHLLVALGASLVLRDRRDEALAVFARQARIAAAWPDRSSLPHAAGWLARLHAAAGDLAAARRAIDDGLAACAALGAKARAAALHEQACAIEEAGAHWREALQHHKRFHALREECAVDLAQRKAAALALRVELERARREALADALTGLGNRRYLDQRLAPWHAQARERGRPLPLALLDIDHFKQINDRHSHLVGDAVLRRLAQLLQAGARDADLCARFGGEEFVLAWPALDLPAARQVAERLRAQVAAEDWGVLASGLRVTVSVGLADLADHASAADGLAAADAALYAAKAAGRDCVRVATSD